MTLPRDIRRSLESGDIYAVEAAWLERLDEDPGEVDFYASVARGLAGTGEAEQAVLLFELLDEQLEAEGLWEERLEFLRRTSGLLFSPEEEHSHILTTLAGIYPDSSIREDLIEKVGLHRAVDDLPKNFRKVKNLRTLMRFDLGSIVAMEGRGVGRVADFNIALEKIKVDFADHGSLSIGFGGAGKLLEPLPPDHILRRKVESPDELEKLASDDPPALLHAVLTSYDKPLMAGEIRQALTGIVTEKRWTSWWTAARKHPQVLVQAGGRQTYSWAESADDALEVLGERFARAKPAEKIDVFRQAVARNGSQVDEMAAELVSLANRRVAQDPAVALAIWHTLDRWSGKAEGLDWSPTELIADSADPGALIQGIEDRQHREHLCGVTRETREDWPEIFAALLPAEEHPRILDLLKGELAANDPERLRRTLMILLSQPAESPATFTWLAERSGKDEELASLSPVRLLQQILRTLSLEAFRPYRARILHLFESGGTVARVLPLLDQDRAGVLEQAIERAGGLEDYHRKPLIAAIHLRFPELHKTDDQPIYGLPESISRLRAELKDLLETEIPANRKAIEEARALGDLRENFEYKSARQRHEYLSSRATNLSRQLDHARPLDISTVNPSEVRIGCRLLLDGDDGERRLTLLGPWESDPEADVISYESDLGASLLGKKEGDPVSIMGSDYQITAIERIAASPASTSWRALPGQLDDLPLQP